MNERLVIEVGSIKGSRSLSVLTLHLYIETVVNSGYLQCLYKSTVIPTTFVKFCNCVINEILIIEKLNYPTNFHVYNDIFLNKIIKLLR